MKKPVLKNYIVIGCVKTIGELWKVLHSDKSIYVRTWGRVHPCKFFLNNDRCFTIKRLEKMIRESAFYRISKTRKWEDVSREEVFKYCKTINSYAVTYESRPDLKNT